MMETSTETKLKLKCGEITLINKRKISFGCNFCSKEVNSIGTFLRHILKEHLIFTKAEMDALLLGTNSKQDMTTEPDTSAETIQQDVEQITDFLEMKNIKVETGPQIENGQIKKESNKFMNNFESFINSSEYNAAKLKHNEDFSYDSSFSGSQIEESYEECELLEEFFEELPTIKKEEIEMREVGFEIEVLPFATTYQHQKEDKKNIEPKIRHITNKLTKKAQATNAPQVKNAKQAVNAVQKAHVAQVKISLQASNTTTSTPAANVIVATNATQSTQQTTAKNNPRIMCKICKKIFKNEELLSVHLQRHAEVKAKPFICEYCDVQFSHKSNLNVHVKRHLGIKPYGCSFCDKSFTSSTELKLHMIKHTGSKLFKCHECNQHFSRQFQLKSHSRRHYNERPYECRTCGNKFFESRQLREHETIHSADRPFSCQTCGATFKRGKALREHKKLHLDVKSYECKICGKTFAQYAGLYAHIKTHQSKTN